MAAATTSPRLTPNLFAISFGFCGLAQCWSVSRDLDLTPAWPADALWLFTAVLWAATLGPYAWHLVTTGRWRTELADPAFGPFTALAAIVPMLLGVALARYAEGPGTAVFMTALVVTVVLGAALAARWIVDDTTLAQWHPGYFLPTVAGGLVGAAGSAALGYDGLARLLFGYGMTCWIVLGSIILARLFTAPALPAALSPTIAIEVAPPVVAGAAWFRINGGAADDLAYGLAGYAVLMVLVQIFLVPLYRRAPFGPAWWSFTFSYAAAFAIAIEWLAVERVPAQRALTYALLAVVTTGIATLAARTVRHLRRGTFLPRGTPGPVVAAPPPRAEAAPVGMSGAAPVIHPGGAPRTGRDW